MATGNFSFENRCVVVTNEDYEFDNLPVLGNRVNDSRNYPSRILKDYDFFRFYQKRRHTLSYAALYFDYSI